MVITILIVIVHNNHTGFIVVIVKERLTSRGHYEVKMSRLDVGGKGTDIEVDFIFGKISVLSDGS